MSKKQKNYTSLEDYMTGQKSAPYASFGKDLDPSSVQQMENACKLPISVRGALMPDAHLGYGLPIGGVLATKNAVIPYAVGVDIACRMKMSILDLPIDTLQKKDDWLKQAINSQTQFGVGAEFKTPKQHSVMDEDWNFSKIVRNTKDKAHSQLGTSGAGNHFVEFGILTTYTNDLKLPPGQHLALLSHSGSRGTGSIIADYYSKLAMDIHPELPKELRHLAWLDIDTQLGQEYFKAMQLMGKYASANHYLIHKNIAKYLGTEVLAEIENHHNFAWAEIHDGKKVIVHRKGATPAAKDVIGIIPGSMATPGYVVKGKANPASLNSAAHGAGRQMSRKAAKKQFNWHHAKKVLLDAGVQLISAGLDEVPMAYKNIEDVMNAQKALVEKIARFDPKIVKMAAK